MEKFRELGIIEPILRVIKEENFERPSEIQRKAVPAVIAGKDVIAGSATGSGKTLVFASSIIQNCEKNNGLQALIMTPTRELAEQVSKHLKKFAKYRPLNITAVYGGVSINPQMDALRRADVVVGTPGRILDHIDRRTINLKKVHILVLDEADRMLDMGFIRDVEKIIRECPHHRQTLLFSATISSDIKHLTKKYMKEPIRISAETYVDASKMSQKYYDVTDNMKFSLLVHLLKHEHSGLVMVFCNTRQNTDFVADNLRPNGIDAMAIHGGFSQAKRTQTIETFHSEKSLVLVCTDVAARGLDIKGVSHIYNYDIPKDSKEYIHRIGRTARAGHEGKVINIVAPRDHENYGRVLRDNQLRIPKEQLPNIERAMIRPRGQGGRFGDRGRGFGGGRRFGGRGDREVSRGGDNLHRREGGGFSRERSSFGGGRGSFGAERRERFGRDRREGSGRERSSFGGDRGSGEGSGRPRTFGHSHGPRGGQGRGESSHSGTWGAGRRGRR